MNLRDALEGVVLKTSLPRGTRRMAILEVETEDDLDRVEAEARRARRRAWMAAYRLRNRDKLRARSREWREKNPEKARALRKRWRAANPEKMKRGFRAASRRAYWKNPEKFRAYQRQYRQEHRDLVLSQKKRHYAGKRDEIRAARQAHYEKNRDRINANRRISAKSMTPERRAHLNELARARYHARKAKMGKGTT